MLRRQAVRNAERVHASSLWHCKAYGFQSPRNDSMKSYGFSDCDEPVLPCLITRRGLRLTSFFTPPHSNSRDTAPNSGYEIRSRQIW